METAARARPVTAAAKAPRQTLAARVCLLPIGMGLVRRAGVSSSGSASESYLRPPNARIIFCMPPPRAIIFIIFCACSNWLSS
jgi:hypothetical protein